MYRNNKTVKVWLFRDTGSINSKRTFVNKEDKPLFDNECKNLYNIYKNDLRRLNLYKSYPSHIFIFLGCASGNKPRLGSMETAYITHNHTLTVKYSVSSPIRHILVVYNFCQVILIRTLLFVISFLYFLQSIYLDIRSCVCRVKYVLIRIHLTKPVRYRYAL